MSELRLGVVGNGLRGSLARLAHRPGEGSAVVAVCDTAPANLERAREWYGAGARLTDRYEQLLGEGGLDGLFVLTPDWLHEEHACAALEAGVPVYLEKPLAITVDSATRILATAARTGTPLYLGHNLRHFGFVRTMKALIDQGAIGRVQAVWCRHFVGHGGDFYFRDWHAERRYSNTLLLQKAAHDLDVIHWLAGGYATAAQGMGTQAIYAHSESRRVGPAAAPTWRQRDLEEHWPPRSLPDVNPVVDVEDLSLVQLQLANGVLASYDQCHFTPDYWRSYTVIGDEGRLENFGNGEPGTAVRVWNRRCGYEPAGHVRVTPATGGGGHGGADEACIGEFLALLASPGKTATITSPVAAWYAVAAGCAASESIRGGGGSRPVPHLDPQLERALEGSSSGAGG